MKPWAHVSALLAISCIFKIIFTVVIVAVCCLYGTFFKYPYLKGYYEKSGKFKNLMQFKSNVPC